MSIVRTRVGPSPTGDPHVGNAYVALINYIYARKSGGSFLLRIEDTDQVRSSKSSEQMILEAFRWLGLKWDEGPDVGGPYGPYRQSERSAIYHDHANYLLRRGHAFKCFCTVDDLDQMRREQRSKGQAPRYDGRCMHLDAAVRRAREENGTPYVVRLVVPEDGVAQIQDSLRGDIGISWQSVDMQVLLKTDGMPTYFMANVVDDHLMGITDILRGEEWLPAAPKHLLLYRYFDWEMPKLTHLPLLRNPDRSKLSKRKNPTGLNFYRRMGYLPEVLASFLGTLTVSLTEEGEDEFLTMDEMVARFDLSKISLGGPVFDLEKLNWLNGKYLREKLTAPEFQDRVKEWALNPPYLNAVGSLAQSRIERLSDLGQATAYLFSGRLGLTHDQLLDGKLDRDLLRRLLFIVSTRCDELLDWSVDAINQALRSSAEALDVKFKDAIRHLYIIITGKPTALPLFESMQLLGRDLCRERLREAALTLGPPSSSEREAWLSLTSLARESG